jgi:DNA-directed RNA polymerase subunit M
MKFCPKCSGILQQKGKELICRCGYKEEAKEDMSFKETIKKKKKEVASSGEVNTMPTIEATCPKCKNGVAYWYTQQTRAGDEAETQFFICTKCGHRWRKY